jgi:hypothetical protein
MNDEPRETSKKNLDQRLARFPEIYERMQRITDQLEESIAKGMSADEAEEIAIAQINELGKAWLSEWAKGQHDRSVAQVQKEIPKAAHRGSIWWIFYHVSEYLGAAAPKVARPKKALIWLRKQKARLLMGHALKILRTLQPHQEPETAAEKPVGDAYRYIKQRLANLDYPKARKADLPIGSGEVESGHRHVIQQRIKIAGAWWRETNAQKMLGLRVARANRCWEAYWARN